MLRGGCRFWLSVREDVVVVDCVMIVVVMIVVLVVGCVVLWVEKRGKLGVFSRFFLGTAVYLKGA